MSDAASKPAPTGRLRVAVYAVDLLRRTALSRVVAEAGHMAIACRVKPARSSHSEALIMIYPACCPGMPARARSMLQYERFPPA